MDLEEWELLHHDGFIDYHEDGEKKTFVASKRSSSHSPKGMFNMNYFMCPSSPPKHSRVVPNQLVPVPIQLEPTTTGKDVPEGHVISKKEVIAMVPIDLSSAVPSVTIPEVKEADQDSVSQVFFKKLKENEFVDMKLDSPKSSNTKGGFVPPQIDAGTTFNFEEQSDHQIYKGDQVLDATKISSPRIKSTGKESSTKEEVSWQDQDSGGLNLWKLSLTGIGAICSFGIAAATICIFIFGSHQRNKHQQQNEKLSFQIYTDDKGIKQVVHHATILNEAISAASKVPIARAHISYDGYHDGL